MSFTTIDRRKNDKGKSTDNRHRFFRRVKQQVREAVKKTINDSSIKDIIDSNGKKVKIPGKHLTQPTFTHAQGGVNDRVYPGNKEFQQGDKINRPDADEDGGGQKGSSDGIGEDAFDFHLTKDEFLDLFFEDLALPDMVKKDIKKSDEWTHQRAGFSSDGNPSQLNIVRSMKYAKGRKLGLRSSKNKKLKKLLLLLEEAQKQKSPDLQVITTLELKIQKVKRSLKSIPYIDDFDLRYNRWDRVQTPTTQAVMVNIMDVSASMGEWEKEMAKRFFMLMYMFLTRNYKRVDIVWIRHHILAKEVDEEEFFNSRETGGTIVSSALEEADAIIKERYPVNSFNIFFTQISDGDNWPEDNSKVIELMERLLPKTQYFAYVEVDKNDSYVSDLYPYYTGLAEQHKNLQISTITDVTEIYPIFRKLFEKS